MVANIMNNKDLTVEVKPAAKVKPVVLSPRYPNGYGISILLSCLPRGRPFSAHAVFGIFTLPTPAHFDVIVSK